MAKQKATITVDKAKVDAARTLLRAKSISETIDVALDRLIDGEQLRHDIAAYRGAPPTDEELKFADLAVDFDLDDADVDYEKLYGKRR